MNLSGKNITFFEITVSKYRFIYETTQNQTPRKHYTYKAFGYSSQYSYFPNLTLNGL